MALLFGTVCVGLCGCGAEGGLHISKSDAGDVRDARSDPADTRDALCRPAPPCPTGWFVYED